MAMSSIFPVVSSSTPQFKVVKSVHKHLRAPPGEKITNKLASKLAGSSEAAARRISLKESRGKRKRCLEDPRAEKTVFIGNIPSSCSRNDVKKLLKPHGFIETIRLRSVRVITGDRPALVAKRTHKQLQEDSTFNAYVVFSTVAEAEECLCLNGGLLLGGRHLRVDRVVKKVDNPQENQRSVFVGNIPFTADEEKLREVFSPCGDIQAVRIVRDSKSGIGKGFGFVMFVEKAGVMFSLRQDKKLKLDGRILRIRRYGGHQVVPKERKFNSRPRKKGDIESGPRKKGSVHSGAKKKDVGVHGGPRNKGGIQRLVATKYVGKRRPDGTKNRLYRIPVSTS